MNNTSNFRFVDLEVGTEFYFCDPATVENPPRFKKVSARPGFGRHIASIVNLATRERKLISSSGLMWEHPVWPQLPTPGLTSLKEEFQKAGERISALEAENALLSSKLARLRRQLLFLGNQP